jgi:hypothetical protein
MWLRTARELFAEGVVKNDQNFNDATVEIAARSSIDLR